MKGLSVSVITMVCLLTSSVLAKSPAPDKYYDAATKVYVTQGADVTTIQDAKKMAQEWLSSTIKTLNAAIEKYGMFREPSASQQIVYAYWKAESLEDLQFLLKQYKAIRKNMKGGVTYTIDKTLEAHGKTGGFAKKQSTLGEDFFGNATVEDRAGTLIHEAAHRQAMPGVTGFRTKLPEASCRDVFSHADPNASQDAWEALTFSSVKKVADQYAAFAAGVNNKDYHGLPGCMPKPLRQHLRGYLQGYLPR
ncbi:MAG: hypothetical protein ACREIH_09520 [Nitrospiraceae bacterium]